MSIQFVPFFSPWQLAAIFAALLFAAGVLARLMGKPVIPSRRWRFLVPKLLAIAVVGMILLNPVRVRTVDDQSETAKAIVLVDASQSMTLPDRVGARWDRALRFESELSELADRHATAKIARYRFGDRLRQLSATDDKSQAPADKSSIATHPQDRASKLGAALTSLAGQLTHRPAGIVVISDGRADDPPLVDAAAQSLARLGLPVDVLAVGDPASQRDVAIHSVTLPNQVRKRAQVPVEVSLQSFGCAGRAAEVRIYELDDAGDRLRELARTDVTLEDGSTTARLIFEAGLRGLRLLVTVPELEGELSATNNEFAAELAVDRTKIRVLQLTTRLSNPPRRASDMQSRTNPVIHTYLQRAVNGDEDAHCVVGVPSGDGLSLLDAELFTLDTRARLFTYDAVILDDISRASFSDELLTWLDEFVSKRGGGVCMIGGPNSFRSGNWHGTPMESLLPVQFSDAPDGWRTSEVRLRATQTHPIWRFAPEAPLNEAVLARLPPFAGMHQLGAVKPGATVLAAADSAAAEPLVVAQSYGRGRTMAIAPALGERWPRAAADAWEVAGESAYDQLWRNIAYWLTEPSTIGRRKLSVAADKQLYRPGEELTLTAEAFTPEGERTTRYRILAAVEPRSELSEVHELDSPFLMTSTEESTSVPECIPWGQELPLQADDVEGVYRLRLRFAGAGLLEAQSALKLLSLRIEATLYDRSGDASGNPGIFLDSAAADVQVANELPELQNPLPNHLLLEELAQATGGRVVQSAEAMAETWRNRSVSRASPTTEQIPLWDAPWLLIALLAVVVSEWALRRRSGCV